MIAYQEHVLENGLKLIHHHDAQTPIVAFNLLYDVGARDEDPMRTGFAHLFEHLMFGGSANIPEFDTPLQQVGGENNAFTTNDLTNYYMTLPKENIETAFWLESDRMLELAFTPKSLEVQRKVVIEEFKQRYLNQPYGDVWLLLRPLAYQVHPYQWPTIGKEISHIEEATMEDVKAFFYQHYRPDNAILSVAGDLPFDQVLELTEKWFGSIDRRGDESRLLPEEPEQTSARTLTVYRDVPQDAIYKTYQMARRKDQEYYVMDLISDILSRGNSSRLYQNLVKDKALFSEVNAYVTGDSDKGLFVIHGKLMNGVTMEDAEAAIAREIESLQTRLPDQTELDKVLNKIESTIKFGEMNVLNKAMSLALSELTSSASLVNEEMTHYRAVTRSQIQEMAQKRLNDQQCSTLYYLSSAQ